MSDDKKLTREAYQQKRKLKAERFERLADKHGDEASNRIRRASEMASMIPMGQPMMPDHHSYKSDVSFRNKIDTNMRKGIEHETTAEYYAGRAKHIRKDNTIYSDDPDAIEKLEDKVTALEHRAEWMKAINAHFRKYKSLDGLQLDAAVRVTLERNINLNHNGAPFPAWEFTNLRGRIKTAKQRTTLLERADSWTDFKVNEIEVALIGGQIQVSFPFKPDEAIRSKLKSSPLVLKWSSYSKKWVRKYTGQGEFFVNELKKVLETAKGTTE